MSSIDETKPFRVLSIDGGGVRGLLPVIWLAHLEQQLDQPLHRYFDLVSGSSIGAVIACAIASGMSAAQVQQTWSRFAGMVFNRRNRITRPLLNLCAYTGMVPRYQASGMQRMLQELFGGQRMTDLKLPALVIAHNPESLQAEIISPQRYGDLPVWSACRASTAAPVFFKPHCFDYAGRRKTLLDGSLSAINPSVIAVSHAIKQLRADASERKIVLASFGTGKRLPNRHKLPKTLIGQGLSLSNALFLGRMSDDQALSESLLSANNCFRFQTLLPASLEAMDAPENLADLQCVADRALHEGMDFHLERLAKRLQGQVLTEQWMEAVPA
jgi:patatin-like phospholipase/acyl hydrolase